MIKYEESMNNGSSKMNNNSRWLILKELYDNYYLNNIDKSIRRIPKKIHQIWLGSEFPEIYKKWQESWVVFNPDYEYKLWTLDNIDIDMENREIFENTTNLGAKSDILRYEILKQLGGIYVDTDFECVKNFDDLLYLDFFAGNGHVAEPEVFMGIIGCVPHHDILTSCVSNLKIKTIPNVIELIMRLTGPYYFATQVFNNIQENMVIFPTTFFYPLPAIERYSIDEKHIKSFNKEETYAVHRWAQSWQK